MLGILSQLRMYMYILMNLAFPQAQEERVTLNPYNFAFWFRGVDQIMASSIVHLVEAQCL